MVCARTMKLFHCVSMCVCDSSTWHPALCSGTHKLSESN